MNTHGRVGRKVFTTANANKQCKCLIEFYWPDKGVCVCEFCGRKSAHPFMIRLIYS